MKKNIFLIVMLVVMCTLTACSNVEETEPNVGKCHYEKVSGRDKVVNFLNELDDEKYNIVSITYEFNSLYLVFYKDIEEAEPNVGKYHYDAMMGRDNVEDFLNQFDYERYEVVSVTHEGNSQYVVFYKDVEQGEKLV